MNIALNHQTDNRTVAIFDLGDHGFRNRRLTTVIFIRITMTAIYHQCRAQSRLLHLFFTLRHVRRTVVRGFPAAQDHVPVRVTLRLQEADLARLVDTDETVRHGGRAHGVDRRRQAAIGTVFKTNRHRQARRHLAVGL